MNFNRIKKVVVVYGKGKVLSSLNFLCTKTRELEEAAKNVIGESAKLAVLMKDVQKECANIMAEVKSVHDDCEKILTKVNEKEKGWSAEAITRVILAGGLCICMAILSYNTKVGALDDLKKAAEDAAKKSTAISCQLEDMKRRASETNQEVCRFCNDSTSDLSNMAMVISNMTDKVKQLDRSVKKELKDSNDGKD